MKQLIYQVYVGNPSKLYDHCTQSVVDYCVKHDIDYICQSKPILKINPDPFTTGRSRESSARLGYLPIFEKENAFGYFPEYDQIAIIDSDVYIRPNAPNIFSYIEPTSDFAAVSEREMPITKQYTSKIINYSNMQYKTLHGPIDFKPNRIGFEFYNMGIMVMNRSIAKYFNGQTPNDFIRRDEFKPFVDGIGAWKWSTDQTLLNYWVKKSKMGVNHLSWKFNGLYGANTRIKDCYFIHFFLKDKLPQRGENVKELMKNV